MAGVQDVSGGDLQGVVLGARYRAAGSHLVAAGDPALLRGVPLERGSDAAAAQTRVDPEGLDVALGQRLAVAQDDPALSAGGCAFPRKRLVKLCTNRFRGNIAGVAATDMMIRVACG